LLDVVVDGGTITFVPSNDQKVATLKKYSSSTVSLFAGGTVSWKVIVLPVAPDIDVKGMTTPPPVVPVSTAPVGDTVAADLGLYHT